MSDDGGTDLSLLIDEERDDGARAASRHRRRRRRRGGGRRALGVLLSLAVLAGLVVGVWYGGRAVLGVFDTGTNPAADYSGSGTGTVEIRINAGDTATDIATALMAADVIASERAFQDAALANPDSRSIQPGLYTMRQQMSAAAALDLLLDPAARLFDLVVIPEGFTVEQALPALAEATGLPVEGFQAVVDAPASLGLPDYARGAAEGFLFPATYELDPDLTAVEVLQQLTAQYTALTGSLQLADRASSLGLTPYEVVIVASMIQSESRVDGERDQIARVIYNRLAQNIPLGIDATTAYGLGIPGTELTTEDFESDSPYNTRRNLGLPPTPISNPGEASLEAALSPANGDWIYYVLEDDAGNHFFTASEAEFLAAKARCEAEGLGCG